MTMPRDAQTRKRKRKSNAALKVLAKRSPIFKLVQELLRRTK